MEEIFTPSVLIYDGQFDIEALRENKQYRNIGQLLMSQKSIRDALRLCGCEGRILNGEASDYECFAAICTAMQYLVGHAAYDGVKRLLESVFGVCEQLSPYSCDELWAILNAFIDDNCVTPLSLLSSLNVESLSVRVSPFERFDLSSEQVDLYPITDIGNIVSLVVSESNDKETLEDFISAVAATFESGANAVHLTLGNDYEFERMSRKHEVYEIYNELKSGKAVSISRQNGLITYVLTSLFGTFCTYNVNVLTELSCRTVELMRLLDYLELNGKLPTSMLIKADKPKTVIPIALEYSFRNEYGLPSIIPMSPDAVALARVFPLGMCLEYQDNVTDAVAIASLISEREKLYTSLLTLPDIDAESMIIDLTYGNIKNRMRI